MDVTRLSDPIEGRDDRRPLNEHAAASASEKCRDPGDANTPTRTAEAVLIRQQQFSGAPALSSASCFVNFAFQRTWPYRSGRSTTGAKQNVKTVVETDTKSELVPPPRFENFESQMANTVTLSGFAMDTPEERSTRDGRPFSRITLAVPRESSRKEITYNYFVTLFFDFAAKQVHQHVQKGVKMVIQGTLSSYNGRVNVIVRDFAFLDDESFQFDQPSDSAEAGVQSSTERTIVGPFLKPSEERVYEDYVQGQDVEAIAKERNIKVATVLSYLADAAFHGKEMDFEWLARNCLLGTGRTRYMKIDNVHAAIQEIIKKEGIVDLAQVPARETHRLVKVSEGGRPFRVQVRPLYDENSFPSVYVCCRKGRSTV